MHKLLLSLPLFAASILFLGGCQTRSISNVGGSGYHSRGDFQGELNELSVLGIKHSEHVENAVIVAALAERKESEVALGSGDAIAVIQSGARFPDDEMLSALNPLAKLIPLSGVPPEPTGSYRLRDKEQKRPDPGRLDKSLRLAAAKGGANKLLVYWGILESAAEPEQVAKQLSWVPLVGRVVPDETQHVQIRVKAALIDVATGNWTMIRTEPLQDKRMSSRLTRESSDLKQVLALKEQAYGQFAGNLKVRFAL